MAKEPETTESGRQDQATDSRPISVSELLARSQAEGGASAAPAARADRGRRRAGRAGAVTVSELTGEIPRITGPAASDTPAQRPAPAARSAANTARSAENGAAESTTRPRAPFPPSAEPTPFPRSANPVARRDGANRLESDPGPAQPQGPRAGGMPVFPPPATRDFSADAVSRRAVDRQRAGDDNQLRPPRADANDGDANHGDAHDATAEAVTGIIPLVDSTPAGSTPAGSTPLGAADDDDPARGVAEGTAGQTPADNFSEVIDDDFDAYRSFADVDVVEAPVTKKRRWFSRKRTTRVETAAVVDSATESTQGLAGPADSGEPALTEGSSPDRAAADTPAVDESDALVTDSDEPTAAAGDGSLRSQPDDVAADAVTGIIPVIDGPDLDDAVVVADSDDADAAALHSPDTTTDAPGATISDAAADTDRHSDDNEDAPSGADAPARPLNLTKDAADSATAAVAADSPTAAVGADPGPGGRDATVRSSADIATQAFAVDEETSGEPGTTESDAPAEPVDTADEHNRDEQPVPSGPSPSLAWLILIGEVLAGLVVGAALFWGFKALWQWSPYFALVLAVLVTFGIVTFAHLVRKSNDLITTLLSLAVGLIVTIGPLVFLAS